MPIFLLTDDLVFPPVHLANAEGLLAVGGDLSPERLLLSYQSGIFPWYSDGDPILWWAPDPRLILKPDEIIISRSLRKTMRKERFNVTIDTHFRHIINACAQTPRKSGPGTWITPEMASAYTRLHQMGYAHSFETWCEGQIVGGLYGVSLGRCFFGESMYATMANASKVALAALGAFARDKRFEFIDCQLPTDHLKSMGAREIPREDFMIRLTLALQYPSLKGRW
jgi:leucyl/phenylalanyl-tRNA---protein transferase